MRLWPIFFGASLWGSSLAGPVSNVRSLQRRQTTSASSGGDILTVLDSVANDQAGNTSEKAANILSRIQGNSNANNAESIETAFDTISDIFSGGIEDIAQASDELIARGLVPSDIFDFLNGYVDFSLNSLNNKNTRSPNSTIYPSKSSDDAPYSLDENTLRGAIYVPSSFSYGADGKQPIILVPGTAVPAGTTYHFSFSKINEAANLDPVWVNILNIPSASLGDAQVNSEYVAYAINYICGVSSSNVTVLSWSQGGLDTQWALKYWPSTRDAVEDFIAVSPDFHGTIEQAFLCPGFPSYPCTPSIWQQGLDSNFIKTIRDDNGSSAYVPTTTLYSTYDEIVQPMGDPFASAFLSDTRGVGVTNNHVQTICPNQPAGGFYTHEGMLYNPVSWALVVDAISHDGPGDPSRLNLDEICSQTIPPQLQLDDVFGTEGLLLVAVAEILGYGNRATSEPAIASYAG